MYAHQVIEDLDRIPYGIKPISRMIDQIRNAQKFHLGNLSGFDHLLGGQEILFKDKLFLPYATTWFDYFFDMKRDRTYKDKEQDNFYQKNVIKSTFQNSHKRGFLAQQIVKDNRSVFLVFVFSFFDEMRQWLPSPVGGMLFSGCKIGDDENLVKMTEAAIGQKIPQEILKANAIPFPFMPGIQKEQIWVQHLENSDEYRALNIALLLLSARNIGLIENNPPEKVNKKRKINGKQPLFTYKTLVIKPTGKRQEAQAAQGLWDNRIHLCRGHFKEYTVEKPLFGRITGRFWWQPSVRGNKEKGVIMKDYEVRNA